MELSDLNRYYAKFKYGEETFHNLMRYRVKEILLVSTFYDAYMFEHDGHLFDQVAGQYINLNLTSIPRITSVPTAEEAFLLLEKNRYDLVITTPRIGKPGAIELAREVGAKYPDTPILLLLTVKSDIALVKGNREYLELFDNLFLWSGDPSLVLAMIKYVEDKRNAPYDTENGLVQVILLVEDSIPFYSAYLPILYKEIMQQTQRLISEELNNLQKYHRMRTRPKVLHARNYEEALSLSTRFREYLLCVLSDVEYPFQGVLDRDAGIRLCRTLRDWIWDIPLVLQSAELEYQARAREIRVDFIHKSSPTLLNDLRTFIVSNLGFGDFIFRNQEGKEIARAERLDDFEKVLPLVPEETLKYHASRNHFSIWLIAHEEFQVARRLRPVKYSDFPDAGSFRDFLINIFREVRQERSRGKIIKFLPDIPLEQNVIFQLREGSLGGKGRGLAFFNALLATIDFRNMVKGLDLAIPSTAVIGSQEYEEFIARNGLLKLIKETLTEQDLSKIFLKARLSSGLREKLIQYLKVMKKPLAVRSSGLLEDSQTQPFAGIYRTYMLPNNSPSFDERLRQLEEAIKLVYSSVFRKETRSYLENLNYRVEEEQMAVIVQEVVGNFYDQYYYPHISGVAQSFNYYPVTGIAQEDGIADIALGLGQFVVEGERGYRFCPKTPGLQFLSQEDYLRYTQTHFYALDCGKQSVDLRKGEYSTLERLDIRQAERDGVLQYCASVWDSQDNRIRDTLSIPGPRVVTFANILKGSAIPLAEALVEILDLSEKALGTPVEIEFALNLPRSGRDNPILYLLQARPLFFNRGDPYQEGWEEEVGETLIYSQNCLGNGFIKGVNSILYIPPESFSIHKTLQIQKEVEEMNGLCKELDLNYILLGPGRWGSRDRFLGIPVSWGQINRAKVIVEYALPEFHPEPSLGTHFFHLLLSLGVGYVTIPEQEGYPGISSDSYIDWEKLKNLPLKKEGVYCRLSVLPEPLVVFLEGARGTCRISKKKGPV